mgnify:CR=1 FL=1
MLLIGGFYFDCEVPNKKTATKMSEKKLCTDTSPICYISWSLLQRQKWIVIYYVKDLVKESQ